MLEKQTERRLVQALYLERNKLHAPEQVETQLAGKQL